MFFIVAVVFESTKEVEPRILGLSLMTLPQRQKLTTVHSMSQSISICPQLNRNHQVCCHVISLG